MTKEELITVANQISSSKVSGVSMLAEALEFLRIYSGEKSHFTKQLQGVSQTWSDDYVKSFVEETLKAFVRFHEKGLTTGLSIERQAQIDVVSDFLSQARTLLTGKGIHPAASCMLIGASLEEFLRNWVEELNLSIGQSKPSLDTYCKALKEGNFITKQDYKDITSWAGLRNHAAHGEWAEVSDNKRIAIMLEGVNLFMRKYGK